MLAVHNQAEDRTAVQFVLNAFFFTAAAAAAGLGFPTATCKLNTYISSFVVDFSVEEQEDEACLGHLSSLFHGCF